MDPASAETTATDGMRGYTHTWRYRDGAIIRGRSVGTGPDGSARYEIRYDEDPDGWIKGERYSAAVLASVGWRLVEGDTE